MKPENLYQAIPQSLPAEVTDTLIQTANVRIERIVSRGQSSPPGFWYDQQQHEWVVLLKGCASIRFAEDQPPVQLKAGDYLNIPAHVRHRVDATSGDEDCVWLAVFY